jgi:hypothetical protein
MKRFDRMSAALLLSMLLSLAPAATAQVVTAQISGDIVDSSGAAVKGVTVVGKNLETGIERTTTSDERGHYSLFNLPLGTYSIRAQITGFKPMVRENIPLSINQSVVIDLTLRPSDVAETVNVEAEVPLINTTTGEVGKTIKTTSIDSLPLNGRDYAQLAALVPGVRQTGTSTALFIGGQAYTSSSFKVDGMDNDSEYVSGRQAKYTQDAIAEIQVLTGQFLPEFGRSSGGVISATTRSGTNELHGRGFYYGRRDALEARNTFATTKPPFSRNQFGGTLGGPIVRNKTFFFGSIERFMDDNFAFVVTPTLRETVPQPTRGLTAFGKITHQQSANHSIQVAYNYDELVTGGQAVGGIQLPDHSFTRSSHQNNILFSDTYVFGPRMVNDLRVQYQRREAGNIPDQPGRPEIQRPSSISGSPVSTPATWNENKTSISENFTRLFTAKGSHSLKMGAQLQFVRGDVLTRTFDNGQFIFPTDKPFNPADATTYPTLYNFTSGDPTATLDNNLWAFHINDEWRPISRLTLNLGLRYDIESGPLVKLFPSSNTNIAPRLSFAWAVTKDRRMVVRGGYGRFYFRLYGNLGTNLYLAGAPAPYGVGQRNQIQIVNPGYPDPYGNNPNNSRVNTPLKTGAFVTGTEKAPYTDNFTVGVQKQLAGGYAFTVDYMHNRGQRYPRPFDQNAPNIQTGIRPIAGYGLLYNYDTSGQTWYDAMLVTIEKKFTRYNQVLISYTLSNTKDTLWPLFASQTGAGPQQWVNPDRGEKAYSSSATAGSNSDSHEPNRLVVNGLQKLPWGFQFSGIYTFFSPRRYNITTGRDNNGDGVLADRPNFAEVASASACGGVFRYGGCYTDPGTGPGVYGNLERNAGIWSKSYSSLNLRLSKAFKIKERSRIELIMETFNTFNRANYSSFSGNIRSALFLLPTAAYDPRQVQFGGRFDF